MTQLPRQSWLNDARHVRVSHGSSLPLHDCKSIFIHDRKCRTWLHRKLKRCRMVSRGEHENNHLVSFSGRLLNLHLASSMMKLRECVKFPRQSKFAFTIDSRRNLSKTDDVTQLNRQTTWPWFLSLDENFSPRSDESNYGDCHEPFRFFDTASIQTVFNVCKEKRKSSMCLLNEIVAVSFSLEENQLFEIQRLSLVGWLVVFPYS